MKVMRMLRNRTRNACWIAFLATIVFAQANSQTSPSFDSGFKSRTMSHVRHLAALGIHDAGSSRERKAARYVSQEMRKAGLAVVNEPFAFQFFTLDDAVLEAGTERADIVKLAFNPYSTTSPITGDLVVVTTKVPKSVFAMNLNDKIVVVADENSFKMVSILKKPKAVLSLSTSDFERLKATGASFGVIRFHGKLGTEKSSNIVGALPAKPGAREIIVSAHYDSVRGPGANDNGSGVAAMLELARYFHASQLPQDVSLLFVAFGAEEAGLLGSKAYLKKHTVELKNCKLLFNIDEIGGNGAIHIDTGEGVKGIPDKIETQLPKELSDKATNDIKDPNQRWSLLSPGDRALWFSSNVPQWLRSTILKASAGLGHEIGEQNRTGSDHRVFVQAGVVATDIGSDGGAEVHAPTDVPEAVDANSIEVSARLVLGVIEDLLHSDVITTE